MYGTRAFCEDVEHQWGRFFPLVKGEGIHFQMHCLANGIRDAFTAGDTRLGRKILAFVEDALIRADSRSEIENAVAISFLEPQEIERLGIDKDIPENVRRVLDEQELRWKNAT
jgi:hypothetical protein